MVVGRDDWSCLCVYARSFTVSVQLWLSVPVYTRCRVSLLAEYPYLSADWQSSVKDRFYDEKIAEVIPRFEQFISTMM